MPDTDYATMPAGLELNALIAEKVMGWRHDSAGYWLDADGEQVAWSAQNVRAAIYPEAVWSPSTDPTADYEVLCHVRKTWTPVAISRFAWELAMLWEARVDNKSVVAARAFAGDINYLPGDFARAGLMTLAAMAKDKG